MATATASITYTSFAFYNGAWSSWSSSATNGYIGYNGNLAPYYTVSCFKIKTPSFLGTSASLSFKFKIRSNNTTSARIYASITNHAPGYTGTTYVGTVPGTDSGRVYCQVHTISSLTSSAAYKTITMSCTSLSSNTEYYIYLSATDQVALSEVYSASSSTVSGTLTYTLPTYAVTYNANAQDGGTVSGLPSNQTKTYGTDLTLRSATPTHANTVSSSTFDITCNGNGGVDKTVTATKTVTTTRTFTGWNTRADGTGTAYSAGATYTANAVLTLYAQWSSSKSTVYTNNTVGTTSRSSVPTQLTQTFVTARGTLSKSSESTTKVTHYTFREWSTRSDGGGSTYTSAATFTSAKTLYAQWDSYDSYGSTSMPTANDSTTVGSLTATFNNDSVITTSTSTRSRIYTLSSFTSRSGAPDVAQGATFSPMITDTWDANWTLSDTIYGPLTMPQPTKPGYVFAGWRATSSGSLITSTSYVPTRSDTYTAVWTPYGGVRIRVNNDWKLYLPYVYTSNQWQQVIPYVYSDDTWKLCGG